MDTLVHITPVMYLEPSGQTWKEFWQNVGGWFTKTFGYIINTEESASMDFVIAETVIGAGTSFGISNSVNVTIGIPKEVWKVWEYSIGFELNLGEKSIGIYTGMEQGVSYSSGSKSYDVSLNIRGQLGIKTSTDIDGSSYSFEQININLPQLAGLLFVLFWAGSALNNALGQQVPVPGL